MSTFTVLTGAKTVDGSIRNWVNRGSDLPATTILTEAQAWIFTESDKALRVRKMMAEDVLTFSAGLNEANLPADFLDPIEYLPYEWWEALPYVVRTSLRIERDSSGNVLAGEPSCWAILGTTAQVDRAPSTAFSGILAYYAKPTALSGANETNFLTDDYPTLLRHACLGKAYSHMKDYQRSTAEFSMAKALIAEINKVDDLYLRGARL